MTDRRRNYLRRLYGYHRHMADKVNREIKRTQKTATPIKLMSRDEIRECLRSGRINDVINDNAKRHRIKSYINMCDALMSDHEFVSEFIKGSLINAFQNMPNY